MKFRLYSSMFGGEDCKCSERSEAERNYREDAEGMPQRGDENCGAAIR